MESMAGEIAKSGSALIRGAIPKDAAVRFGEIAVSIYLRRNKSVEWGSLLQEAPGFLDLVVNGQIGATARGFLNSDFIMPLRASRTHVLDVPPKTEEVLPYHQDAYALPPTWRSMTAWILLFPQNLSVCARLELIKHHPPGLLPKDDQPDSKCSHIEVRRSITDDLAIQYGTWVPDATVGDAVVFSDFTPHRTLQNDAEIPRLAQAIRFVAAAEDVLQHCAHFKEPFYRLEDGCIKRHY